MVTRYLLCCTALLLLAQPALAEDSERIRAEKALADAKATQNPDVIEAVKHQLLRDHPDYASWVNDMPGPSEGMSGRVAVMSATQATPPKAAASTDPVKISGHLEGGFSMDSGNTQGNSVNAKADVTRDSDDWRFLAQGSTAIDRSDGATTKEQYRALGQANYKIHPDERWMSTIFFNSDRFTGFADRFDEVTGLSNDWKFDGSKATLTTELAAGAREVRLIDDSESAEPIIWLRGLLNWPVNDRLTFTEELRDSAGTRYTFLTSNSAFITPISEQLKLKLSFEADYVTNSPLGREPLDTQTLATLVYGF